MAFPDIAMIISLYPQWLEEDFLGFLDEWPIRLLKMEDSFTSSQILPTSLRQSGTAGLLNVGNCG